MNQSLTFLAFLASMAPFAALAAEPIPLTYETFEHSVPHVDLAECPADLATEDGFCRATLAGEQIHVFVFSYDGDNPLTGYAAYDLDGFAAALAQP